MQIVQNSDIWFNRFKQICPTNPPQLCFDRKRLYGKWSIRRKFKCLLFAFTFFYWRFHFTEDWNLKSLDVVVSLVVGDMIYVEILKSFEVKLKSIILLITLMHLGYFCSCLYRIKRWNRKIYMSLNKICD